VPEERPLAVVVHGAPGALAGGQFGTTLSALAQIADSGRDVMVYLTEARPFMEGARLANWELRQLGVEHRVVPDAAVAWVLANERIDAVLLTPDWITADGSMAALIGSLAVAQQARACVPPDGGDRPLVIAAGSSVVIDLASADGAELPSEMRPTREINSYLDAVHIGTSEATVPATDVLAPATIDMLITEHGPMRPMTAEGLREIAEPVVERVT
jgi:methylthioribose-1-phosphate isomerase